MPKRASFFALLFAAATFVLLGACSNEPGPRDPERISGDVKVSIRQQVDQMRVGQTQFATGWVRNLSNRPMIVDIERTFEGGPIAVTSRGGRFDLAAGRHFINDRPVLAPNQVWFADFKLTCNDVGPGNWSYNVETTTAAIDGTPTSGGDFAGERSRATVDHSVECTAPPTEVVENNSIAVQTLEIDEKRYPRLQFITVGNEDSGFFWSTEAGQLVQPLPGDDEWLTNSDPGGEGFGSVDDLEADVINVPLEDWQQFCDTIAEFAGREPGVYTFVIEECQESAQGAPTPTPVLETPPPSTPDDPPFGRPTATPATRGVLVTVLKIGDAHYYIHQFDHLRSPAIPLEEPGSYRCGDNEYAVHLIAQLERVRSFEYPDEPLEDPDVTGCGFGMTEGFVYDGPDADSFVSVLQAEFPEARFTSRVIGEWCKRIEPELLGPNQAIERLCDRNRLPTPTP